MGKSTVASIIRARGGVFLDADDLARRFVEPGEAAWQEIRETFGPAFFLPDGRLNRAELARLVFTDVNARRRLEAILHPRICSALRSWIQERKSEGSRLITVVVPLLYEVGMEKEVDVVICVACTKETQYFRLRQRGWSEGEIVARNSAQWPIEKKMELADFVIWTEGDLQLVERQVDRIISCIG